MVADDAKFGRDRIVGADLRVCPGLLPEYADVLHPGQGLRETPAVYGVDDPDWMVQGRKIFRPYRNGIMNDAWTPG